MKKLVLPKWNSNAILIYARSVASKNSTYVFLLICLGLVAFTLKSSSHSESGPRDSELAGSIDTFIPEGSVLVPVDIQNSEALESIVGDHGVVDLYEQAHEGEKRGRKVAYHVRLLRAPLNPKEFAVLVEENEASILVRSGGPFIAVVQSPKAGASHVPGVQRKKSRLVYND
jgi:hypothetical protein